MSVKKKSSKHQPNKVKLQKAKKKGAWFVATRWSYIPISPQGWALYLPYIAYLILVMVVASYAQTVAEAILIIIPGFVAGAIAMQWIASNKS